MSTNIVTNSNITTKVTTPLTLTSCNYFAEVGFDFTPVGQTDPIATAQCFSLTDYPLDQIGNISGIFEQPYFRYLEVNMNRCVGKSPTGKNCTDPGLFIKELY
jgi:hypothetical protein